MGATRPHHATPAFSPHRTAAHKAQMGRATWSFLHTLAEQYPERPNAEQQRDIKNLIVSLSRVYPCNQCSSHFQEIVRWGQRVGEGGFF